MHELDANNLICIFPEQNRQVFIPWTLYGHFENGPKYANYVE